MHVIALLHVAGAAARRWVGEDGDRPGLGAEDERITGARLEDELFVQPADPGLAVGGDERVEAAVGDSAATLDGQQTRAGQRGQAVVDTIPREAGLQVAGNA